MMTAIALSSSSLDRYIYCLLILASSSDVLRANVIDSVIGPYPRSSVAPGRRRHSTVIIFILNINRANPRNSILYDSFFVGGIIILILFSSKKCSFSSKSSSFLSWK